MRNSVIKTALLFAVIIMLCSCTSNNAKDNKTMKYKLSSSFEVNGRQGVAFENGYYYVSGSATLTKYDSKLNVVMENLAPFDEGYELEVNHIGDIDVYNGEIYCSAELFLDGVAKNIQIAVYDCETLKLNRTFNFEEKSGQTECSGITVNPDNRTVWMCSWADGEDGKYLYKYSLDSGEYLGKVLMNPAPKWIQGVKYYDGAYYVTADDGDADLNKADHIYKMIIVENATECKTETEKSLDDVTRQGEIEGLTFIENSRLAVLYNRGARIILGMPKGFYDGYNREIHEVFIYDIV